jgi:nucleoside-diphosphate-sugar epimerase
MKKILVTGGAGYLGSVLTGRLLAHQYKVTVLDNLLYGQTSLLQYANNPQFEFVLGDVRDEGVLKQEVKKADAIVHLAAIVGAKACERDPQMAQSVNLEAVRLLNRVRSPHQAVLYPCTNSGYGTKSGDVYCTEETPLEPISLYGESKVAAERELLSAKNAVSLRLATVFGPSQRMRLDLLVNDFVHRAFFDRFLVIYEKNFKRNYLHIEDMADCFLFSLEYFDSMRGQAYNVGLNEANLSKAELAYKIKEHISSLYIHFAEVGTDPDKRNYIVSNDKLRKSGFVAKHSLDEGITQLIKTYKMLPRGHFANA